MRIISGKYKGQYLVNFKADHIRPTTDRVKESMFNILMGQIENAKVLDLFSGTGNLGIEALSRGAQKVTFVELSKKSIQILKENIIKLKVTEPHEIINKNVIQFLKSYSSDPYDIIFADPPFTEEMGHEVVQAVDISKVMGRHTVLLIESARREKMDDEYSTLIRYDKREFGDKVLSFYRKKENTDAI